MMVCVMDGLAAWSGANSDESGPTTENESSDESDALDESLTADEVTGCWSRRCGSFTGNCGARVNRPVLLSLQRLTFSSQYTC